VSKNDALRVLNPVLAACLVSQGCTGLLHDSLPHEVFEILHKGGGIALFLGVALHVVLNFGWVRSNFFRKR
jgi:hypothetical protein